MSQRASSTDSAKNTSCRPLVWRAVEPAYEEQASSEVESQASEYSEKTNEFPPGYLETRLAVEKMIKEYDQHTFSINQLDLSNTWPGRSRSCYPSIRILLKHKKGNKAIKTDTEPLSLEAPLKEGVADSLGNKVELLCIPQHKDSLQCTLLVGTIQCALIYDTESDDIFIRNISNVVLYAFPMSRTGAGLVSVMPLKIGVLAPTLWEFRSGEDRMEVEVLPRQYLLRVEQSTTAIAGSKRSLPSEQEVMQQKKARGNDQSLLLNSATAPLLDPQPPQGLDLGYSLPAALHKEREEVTAAFQLEPWQKLCIVDKRTGNTEYSFTRLSKWENRTQSSELFRAILRKQAIQKGEVVVVKVIKGDTVAQDDTNIESKVAHKWFHECNARATRFSRATHHGAALINFSEAVEGRSFLKDGSTPWYLSPEALENLHGRERDIYALGVVMLYLIGCIGLPERTEPELITSEQVEAWHTRVEDLRKSLRPRDGHTGTEAELVAIVRGMLRQENRVTAEQLEKVTRGWASETAM
ncbi:hypothetical protein SLS53_005635 [Cytospora paraplurivora]|uniref:Protein kinase domain-containing protein n=1 Tax=Cytospora paraplurivora TaxID=2898453 RepID=A0AAN9U7H4_9PEZI